jgi:hypothetical protein
MPTTYLRGPIWYPTPHVSVCNSTTRSVQPTLPPAHQPVFHNQPPLPLTCAMLSTARPSSGHVAVRCAAQCCLLCCAVQCWTRSKLMGMRTSVTRQYVPYLVVLDLLLDESPSARPQQVIHNCMVVKFAAMRVRLHRRARAETHTHIHLRLRLC